MAVTDWGIKANDGEVNAVKLVQRGWCNEAGACSETGTVELMKDSKVSSGVQRSLCSKTGTASCGVAKVEIGGTSRLTMEKVSAVGSASWDSETGAVRLVQLSTGAVINWDNKHF